HWPVSTLALGIMGLGAASGTQGLEFPCQLKKSGNNLVSSPASPGPFTDLDLYMMGLVKPSEVGEHYVVTDATVADQLKDSCTAMTLAPSQFTTVNVQNVITQYGARTPTADGSSLKLRIANILITRDTLADADTISLADFYARRYQTQETLPVKIGLIRRAGAPLSVAPAGRASVSTQLTATALPEISAGGIASAGNFV